MARRRKGALVGGTQTAIGIALIAVGSLATIGTLAGFLGRYWWVFDVLANFRLQYGLVAAATAILYGIAFGRVSALVFFLAAALNAALIAPFYLDEPQPRAADAQETLDVIGFNVGVSNRNREAILEWIEDQDADLVFLFETSRDWDNLWRNADGYRLVASRPGDRQFGIAVLAHGSREVDAETLRVAAAKEQVVRVEVAVDGREVVLFGVHPRSPTSRTRAEMRNELLAEVAGLVEAEDAPAVVVGDFNATPWSYPFRKLVSDAELVDSMRGHGLQPSWPDLPWVAAIPIDHVLHDPALTTIDRRLGPTLGSDHHPVLASLTWAEE